MTGFNRQSSGPTAPSGPPARGVRWPEPADGDRGGWNAPPAPRRFPDNAPGSSADRPAGGTWDPAGRRPADRPASAPAVNAPRGDAPRPFDADPHGRRQQRTARRLSGQQYDDAAQSPAYGRPAWFAVLVMVAVTAIGVVIDVVRDATGGVNIAIIVGALLAILIVRRLAMFPVVIAPPLVYILGSAAVLYLRSGGPHNKTVLIDIATNWLVYGFPAMAAATAIVLAVAGIRMVARR